MAQRSDLSESRSTPTNTFSAEDMTPKLLNLWIKYNDHIGKKLEQQSESADLPGSCHQAFIKATARVERPVFDFPPT